MTDIIEYMKKSHDELLGLAFSGDELAQDIISGKARKFAEFQAHVDSIAEVMDKEYTVRIKSGKDTLDWMESWNAYYGDYMQIAGKFVKVKIDWTSHDYFLITVHNNRLECKAYLPADLVITQLPEVRKMRALWKYWSDAKKKLERA